MHLPTNQPEALAELAHKIRDITASLLEDAPISAEPTTIAPCTDIFAHYGVSQLLLLQSGRVNCALDGKTLCHFDHGDLLGLMRTLSLPAGIYSCDEPIEVLTIERDALINYVGSHESVQKLWSYYLVAQLSWYHQALAQEITREFQPSAGFLHFAPGEIIIRHGDSADLVYTLLEGHAHAIRDGVKVGDIRRDEIFGALAVFTGQPRIADVVAHTDCTVLTVRKDEFIELVDHQPHICIGLIEEMADKINQLNSQLLSARESSPEV